MKSAKFVVALLISTASAVKLDNKEAAGVDSKFSLPRMTMPVANGYATASMGSSFSSMSSSSSSSSSSHSSSVRFSSVTQSSQSGSASYAGASSSSSHQASNAGFSATNSIVINNVALGGKAGVQGCETLKQNLADAESNVEFAGAKVTPHQTEVHESAKAGYSVCLSPEDPAGKEPSGTYDTETQAIIAQQQTKFQGGTPEPMGCMAAKSAFAKLTIEMKSASAHYESMKVKMTASKLTWEGHLSNGLAVYNAAMSTAKGQMEMAQIAYDAEMSHAATEFSKHKMIGAGLYSAFTASQTILNSWTVKLEQAEMSSVQAENQLASCKLPEAQLLHSAFNSAACKSAEKLVSWHMTQSISIAKEIRTAEANNVGFYNKYLAAWHAADMNGARANWMLHQQWATMLVTKTTESSKLEMDTMKALAAKSKACTPNLSGTMMPAPMPMPMPSSMPMPW